jgi:Mg2+-importing ATPase
LPLICLPGKYLLAATLLVVAATIAFPYTPLAVFCNFQPLSLEFLLLIGLILLLYISAAEVAKRFFYLQVRH